MKFFFSYDSIEYYLSNFHDSVLVKLDANRSKSVIDSLKRNLLIGEIPESISDFTYIDKLSQMGFQKKNIGKSSYTEINNIFIEKKQTDSLVSICPRIYRDILVFKKDRKIVGIAKICFSCGANKIIGTKANTDNFGSNGDYSKLQDILPK